MHEFIASIAERMKRMPFGLRVLTVQAVLFTSFAPVAFLPGIMVNGIEVSYRDWWLCGGGPTFIAVGIAFGVIAYGFLRATHWSRPLYFVVFALQLIIELFSSVRVADCISAAFPVVLLWLYLFRRRTVCAYYAESSRTTVA